MAALDNIASELLKSANEADLIYKRTRDQAQRDKAVRLRRIVENLKAISAGGLTPTLDEVLTEGNVSTNTLNVGGITSDYFQFDTAATPTLAPGMFAWNDAYGTADLRLKGNNVTLQVGQEILARVVNKTGSDLLESQYKVVRVRIASEGGAQGQRLAVVLAQGDNDPDSATTLGVVTETILNNQEGFITILGNVNNINTTGSLQGETWVDGDVLYLSPTTPGSLTKVKPVAPQHTLIVGYVVYAHINQGKIFVKVDNGYELDELHNVLITSPANNDLLQYNSTQQVWKNVASSVAVPTPTLAQVTTAGNTTTNAITVGNITVNSSTNELKIFDVTGGNYTRIKDRRISFSRNSGTSESVSIYSPDNQLWLTARSGIYVYSGSNPGETYFFAKDYSGTNRIQVKDTGAVILQESNNNVLIGTTTDAGYKLDVNGTMRVNNHLYFTNPSFTGTMSIRITANNQITFGNAGIGDWLQAGGSNRVFIFQELNSTSRGNVFGNTVGTTAVNISTLPAISSGTANLIGLNLSYSINNTGTYVGIARGIYYNPVLTSLTGTTHRAIETVTGNVVFGSTSGNVLVGTTTDAGYKLDVNGTGRFTNNLSITKSYNLTWGTNQQINVTDYPSYFSGGYNVMSFISTSSGSYADDGSFIWRNAGTSKNLMVLTGVGNLGLGISNPTDKFHIVDNTNGNKFARISAGGTDASAAWVAQNDQVDNIVYRVFGSAVTGSQMGQALARSASLIANLGGTGKFLIGSFSSTDLIFGTSDQARMRLVDATGNFLIGTMTDTGNKLTVSGNIDAQGYKVNNVLGYTGILNIPTNPPGQQNIDIRGGIVINIF